MTKTARQLPNPVAPRQQHNWDWRAAANFITGGAGGGLLLCAALANIEPGAVKAAVLLGLALIGIGLTCVWFEIGRPLRAFNVFLHFASSWMTREAVAAALLFVTGGLAVLGGQPVLVALTGALGLIFVCCQASMLWANKGIPAWRHPRSLPLMIGTDLAEGAGFLACLLAAGGISIPQSLPVILLAMILLRAYFWKRFLSGLADDGAPQGALKVLRAMDLRFLLAGHVLPALAVAAALAGLPGRAGVIFAAGILVVASGWYFKFYLIRRAAFTQGLALPHLPVHGRGEAGPSVRPGWTPMPGEHCITGER